MAVTFKSLSFLNKNLVDKLSNLNYTICSQIQEKAIPTINKNTINTICLAPTGTGKTLTYLIPVFNDIKDNLLNCLIVVPTTTLGEQIFKICQELKKNYKDDLSITFLKNEYDLNKFKESANILIIVPSLIDKLSKSYNLKTLTRVIIDEGDMIAFDGFAEELSSIKFLTKATIHLFSASLNEHEVNTLKKILGSAKIIDVRENGTNNQNITHYLVDKKHYSNLEAIQKIVEYANPYKTIIFVSNKKDILPLSKELYKNGVDHRTLQGDLDDNIIKNTIKDFKDNKFYILLASDFASRGLDIEDVDCVISIDLPKDLTYYLHRAGRAGRFDRVGKSFVLYTENDETQINNLKNKNIKFSNLSLTFDGIKEAKKTFQKPTVKKSNNPVLEAKIKQAARKARSNKVKPNYKKKVKLAVERVKRKHRQGIVFSILNKKASEKR